MKNRISFRRDIPAIGAVMLMTLLIILSLTSADTVYGSKTDWASQHYAIPEYFRTLFYDTGQLIPSYAPNIGGGGNIFLLSYYGLLSPVILPSYLLPSVPMGTYIMISSILAALISECGLYFLFRRRYTPSVSLLTTVFFALSVPLILNTHRQIMFTSFMPFLLMALHGAEEFFRRGAKALLALGVFLTVMCNYYFAPAAVTAIFVYGIWLTLGEKGKPDFKRLLPFTLCIIAGVTASAVLILPTAHVLISGRDASAGISLKELLPTLQLEKLTYYNAPLGLSGFGVLAAFRYLFKGSRQQRLVSVITLSFAVFPITLYILNGTLYADPKVLFPFLPMALTLTADMLSELDTFRSRKLLAGFVLFSALSFFTGGMNILAGAYLADALIASAAVYAVMRTKKQAFSALLFAVPMFVCLFANHYDELTPREKYETANSESVTELIQSLPDDEIYRTAVDTARLYTVNKVYTPRHYSDTVYSSLHSQEYSSFYFNEMYNENEYRNSALMTRSRNIIFSSFMGDRFYVTDKPVTYSGLAELESAGGYYLYENKNAFPMAYIRKKTMSRRQYDQLDYPDSIAALMNYTIVQEDIPDTDFRSCFEKADIGDIFSGTEQVEPSPDGKKRLTYKLPEEVRGKLLLLRFHVSDPAEKDSRSWENKGDVRITVNGVKNTLSDPHWKYSNGNNWFEYVISDMRDELEIAMSGSDIRISDLEAYTLAPEMLTAAKPETAFKADMAATHGDTVKGSITSESGGIAATSLVMQDGFTVLVDGEEVKPVMVNTAFLGFPIESGTHEVELHFRAPLLGAGKLISAVGTAMLLICLIMDIISHNKRKKAGQL